jgi:hypothetical protein
MIFYAFPYRPVGEEIWRRGARVAKNAFILMLQCVIGGIVAILNVEKPGASSRRARATG